MIRLQEILPRMESKRSLVTILVIESRSRQLDNGILCSFFLEGWPHLIPNLILAPITCHVWMLRL
uniref:Uncharacterized protein n=1 Tax=Arundo donax TaxID=35708 RepID=A0A0A9CLV5_ARUDO